MKEEDEHIDSSSEEKGKNYGEPREGHQGENRKREAKYGEKHPME